MSRTEFLRALRQKLLESMSASEADEQVRYYDNYIKKAVQNGQNEREVLAALGDPVLIARTILEAPGRRAGEPRKEYSPKEENPYQEQEEKLRHIKRVSTFGCILGLIVALLILFVVFGTCDSGCYSDRSDQKSESKIMRKRRWTINCWCWILTAQ